MPLTVLLIAYLLHPEVSSMYFWSTGWLKYRV